MDYRGQHCPICGKEFCDGDDIVVCPECGTPKPSDEGWATTENAIRPQGTA